MLHHIHAFQIHVTVLILLKGVLYALPQGWLRINTILVSDFLVMVLVEVVHVKYQLGTTSS